MAKVERTENVVVRCTAADKRAMQRAADSAGLTLSEYVRAAALTSMALSANPHAVRTLLEAGAEAARAWITEPSTARAGKTAQAR